MTLIYKIITADEWKKARIEGIFMGSVVDQRDGFIHFSAASQLRETAAKHFSGQTGLVLLTVDAESLPNMKWEISRGGALFPHLYGPLAMADVRNVIELPWSHGTHHFPPGIPA